MKKNLIFLILLFTLAACAPAAATPTSTATPAPSTTVTPTELPTLTPTVTFSPTPEPSPTPEYPALLSLEQYNYDALPLVRSENRLGFIEHLRQTSYFSDHSEATPVKQGLGESVAMQCGDPNFCQDLGLYMDEDGGIHLIYVFLNSHDGVVGEEILDGYLGGAEGDGYTKDVTMNMIERILRYKESGLGYNVQILYHKTTTPGRLMDIANMTGPLVLEWKEGKDYTPLQDVVVAIWIP